MSKKLLFIHTFICTPLLNLYSLFLVNPVYDNQTGLGYLKGHLALFLIWALLTVIGTYIYSIQIWNQYKVPYSKSFHLWIHIGMFISCCIPYSKSLTPLNDLHVWGSMICICLFIYEWARLPFQEICFMNPTLKKKVVGLLFIFGLATFPYLVAGSIISLGEILYSILVPVYLYIWLIKS